MWGRPLRITKQIVQLHFHQWHQLLKLGRGLKQLDGQRLLPTWYRGGVGRCPWLWRPLQLNLPDQPAASGRPHLVTQLPGQTREDHLDGFSIRQRVLQKLFCLIIRRRVDGLNDLVDHAVGLIQSTDEFFTKATTQAGPRQAADLRNAGDSQLLQGLDRGGL